jgi:hypothetical protein
MHRAMALMILQSLCKISFPLLPHYWMVNIQSNIFECFNFHFTLNFSLSILSGICSICSHLYLQSCSTFSPTLKCHSNQLFSLFQKQHLWLNSFPRYFTLCHCLRVQKTKFTAKYRLFLYTNFVVLSEVIHALFIILKEIKRERLEILAQRAKSVYCWPFTQKCPRLLSRW